MAKNVIKINEQQLKEMIAESVKKVLNEGAMDEAFFGLFGNKKPAPQPQANGQNAAQNQKSQFLKQAEDNMKKAAANWNNLAQRQNMGESISTAEWESASNWCNDAARKLSRWNGKPASQIRKEYGC